MLIKYHDNTTGIQYGEDHTLTNNWNPNLDYGTEHVHIHFRIHTKGYEYPSFSFNEEDRAAFDHDIRTIFTALGWTCENEVHNGTCSTWKKDHSHLYMHPQDFSGEVLKNEVRLIAENLAAGTKSFTLEWVDLYGTSYVMTDEEWTAAMTAKNEEIRHDILIACQTTRRSHFKYTTEICRSLANKHRIFRAGEDDGRYTGGGKTYQHILNLVGDLISEGYLIEHKTYIRTINKTEQKQKKLYI